MEQHYEYLVVGGGMAADAAAKALYDRAPQARVAVIGEEKHAPYARPPLSKGAWQGQTPVAEEVDLATAGHGTFVYTDRHIVSLNAKEHVAVDDKADKWTYGKLLLATGASPRKMDGFPEHERLIYFRNLDDFHALRRFAHEGAHIAVIGSGFIGSEIAAALLGAGCKVTMVFPQDNIGAGRFPDDLSAFITDYYRDKGIALRVGVTVTGGTVNDSGATLALSDGSELAADAVVAGLGVIPNTLLAKEAGLELDNGVVADKHLVSSHPDIFVAGDVANFYNPALDRRMRVEHEDAAVTMGGIAGRNMAGASETYDMLPFFYSDMFDLGYEAVGLLDNNLEVFADWHTPFREGVVYYHDGKQVRGVLLWNVWDQVDKARELIASPNPVDEAGLRGFIS